jgi:predicted ATPase/DNA-binding SARP family transcriptional activator
LEIGVLGPLTVLTPGGPVVIGAAKPRTLLACLALRAGTVVPADELHDQLWAGDPPPSARKLVQVYVSQLRKAGIEVTTRPSGYQVAAATDSGRFEQLLESARDARLDDRPALAARLLDEALGLWRGPALTDVGPMPALEDEARRLEDLRLVAEQERLSVRLDLGGDEDLVPDLRAQLASYPLRERLWALLMTALYRAGRQGDALEAYQEARGALAGELGVEPGEELRSLHAAVLAQDPALGQVARRRFTTGPLPSPASVFVGRAEELENAGRMLATTRLLTLSGPGGTGKTRLALELAGRARGRYAGGAVAVSLAPVETADAVLPAIAHALQVRPGNAAPLEAVIDALRDRRLLLLLDNVEHVVDAAADVGRLLEACPDLTVLATSRTVLNLAGELVFAVPPLGPDDAHALFRQRSVEQQDPASVARICAFLEGLPLALELAAAQTRVLSTAELLARLTSRLDAPGPGPRDLPTRHRSLRAALDGSYELLTEPERLLLQELAAFRGTWTFEMAQQLCDAGHETIAALIDHSLVRTSPTARRFFLLDTVREYAAERQDAGVPARHAECFLARALAAEAELAGPGQAAALEQLDLEHEDMRAALAYFTARGAAEQELRLAGALARFWYLLGHLAESRDRLAAALAHADGATPLPLLADSLRKASAAAVLRGEYDEASAYASRALALYRDLRDDVGTARALSNLGAIEHALGALDRAAASLQEAIALARTLPGTRICALALNNRGDLALTQGQVDEAVRLFAESRALLEEAGDTANIARSLLNSAFAALAGGDAAAAAPLLLRSIGIAVDLGDAEDVAWCLLGAAAVAVHEGDAERAGRLLGASRERLRRMHAAPKPYERGLDERCEQALTADVGPGKLAVLLAEGAALDRAAATALVSG